MNYLSDRDRNFWLPDVGVLCIQIGDDPAGLSQSTTLAILAVLRLDSERALATRLPECDVVQ